MRRIDSASITDMDNYYSNQPDGIAGNEDCAQTSAWYVFTAMGFYPLNPVSGDYMIGSPLFTKLTLQLAGNKGFVISAPANSADNPHIQSVRLNAGRSIFRSSPTGAVVMARPVIVVVVPVAEVLVERARA
jgi:putative alpha-1,2-mannosidase